ncbi:DUF2334 domain-containing protein [Allosphingosinicella sp.]|jgi:uncharacterized protein YdaL|uniref:DUF2334 domain-containing protein n=1 Tax=Allosphingosinicella sp. TaxID=2823234 RepID=UPI002F0C40AB
MAPHHWILRLAFLGLAVWLVFAAWAQSELRAGASPAGAGSRPRQILVLYQDDPAHGADLNATLTANLIGRFGRPVIRSLAEYRSGEMERYDSAFILPAAEGPAPPQALLQDVRASRRPVVWVHHGVEALFADRAFAAASGWAPGSRRAGDYVGVRYKGRDFPRDIRNDAEVVEPRIVDPRRARAFATALGPDGREVPWAVRSGNFVYVLESPFAYAHEDDRYLVFADLLFEILAPDTPERHRAMVRIDQVGPETNPRRIRALAELLAEEKVPFSIAVHDTYRDPEGRNSGGQPLQVTLRERPGLVRALEYSVSLGATLVAHGHTHQTDHRPNPYGRVSGSDYEFFAADLREGAFELKGPLPDNMVAQWRDRFEVSRSSWSRAGLAFPEVFTTPHYAASSEAYAAARERFRARYERSLYFAGESHSGRALFAQGWETQFFPFETVDVRGDFIIPENLGFASSAREGGLERGIERLIASAERNLAVRDGFASFFHHWHEDPEALRAAVRGIKRLGYRFVGPAQVMRDAPAHAPKAHRRPSPLAVAASSWVRALPRIDLAVLVALLALVGAMWLTGEMVLRGLDRARSRRVQRAA